MNKHLQQKLTASNKQDITVQYGHNKTGKLL